MPERKKPMRISTTEVQGEDSYVVVSRITIAESRRIGPQAPIGGPNPTDVLITALADHVHEWNWVDSAGAPLAAPFHNVSVMELLTDEEALFLSNAIGGPIAERRKN